jgi:hypothetical protein
MKRSAAILLALVLGIVTAAPLGAAPKPSLEDPQGDANFVNDQGTGDGSFGDHILPASPSTVGDLLKVTFTNDAKNLYVHIATVAMPPATQGVGYRVRVNPDGPGGTYCLNFEAFFPGATNNLTANEGHFIDLCEGAEGMAVEATFSPLGGSMIVVPRKSSQALGKGKKLTGVQAHAFVYSGTSYPAGVVGPYIDTTKPGKDYALKK